MVGRLSTAESAELGAEPVPVIVGGVLRWWIPWALLCSDNRKYAGRSLKVLSREYRAAKEGLASHSATIATVAGWAVTDAPLSVRWVVREPDARRRDLSFSKQVKDAITLGGGIWRDDAQVREEHWLFVGTGAPVSGRSQAAVRARQARRGQAGAWCWVAPLGQLPPWPDASGAFGVLPGALPD